ncbi:MAG: hypothetical protein ACREX3_23570 [Gammaproteobacteria bacterium]
MRPLRGLVLADSVRLLTDRYQFVYPPDLSRWENVQSNPLLFRSGKLERNRCTLSVGELGVYSDGISVNASSTEVAEEVLSDLLDWSKSALGMRELQRPARKTYHSAVVVEFDHDVGALLSRYARICSLLSDSLKATYNTENEVKLNRLAFSQDPTKTPTPSLAGEFVIERRVNYPYEVNRFFCSAHLPTDEHVRLLQQIEMVMAER